MLHLEKRVDKLALHMAVNQSANPMLLTRDQVAKTLQVSTKTIDRMRERGTLAAETVEGKPRFRANVVAEILLAKGYYSESINEIMSKLQAEALTEKE